MNLQYIPLLKNNQVFLYIVKMEVDLTAFN